MKKVAMIGVGKLGQDCAEVMSQHYDVVGYDISPRTPLFPMMPSIEQAVKDRDIIFIAAPTAHDPMYGGETPTSHLPNKDFDYTIVIDILTEVNKYVNKKQLVVLISTVLPGTVRNHLEPCITNARFIYNPYLIAMGTVKWDMVNPEMLIIGTEDGSLTGDAQELIEFYKVFMENNPRYEVGTWDEAESIKIFYNTFISTKLALVNMIQDVAEANGNINVDVVTSALAKSTQRIMGPGYMKAGLGDGGACHPRDNIALRYLADRLDLGYDLFDSIMKAREVQAEKLAKKCLANGNNITIIGKAYKPGVPYTIGSPSLLVGHYIEKLGGNVNYYDPNTNDHDLKTEWTNVYLIGYIEEWVLRISFPPGSIIIDPWRVLDPNFYALYELIQYGNTRKKKNYRLNDKTRSEQIQTLFNYIPEIETDERLYYIYASTNADYTFFQRKTEDIVQEIQIAILSGKTRIIFDNMSEAMITELVKKVELVIQLVNAPSAVKFYFTTSALNAKECYLSYCKIKNKLPLFEPIVISVFEQVMQSNFRMYNENVSIDYDISNKEKKFVCFNRVPRLHRIMVIAKLLEQNLFDQGYCSLEGDEGLIDSIETFLPSNIAQQFDRFKGKMPIRLNITSTRQNPIDIVEQDIEYHKNSYFSIVTETTFYKNTTFNFTNTNTLNSVFLTEKIYRPIVLKHPFLLVSRPHSLKFLKDLGYKTFHPFIDESYDTIVNDYIRLEKIMAEVDRLCKFTDDQWIEWQKNIKLIVEYNHNLLMSKQNFLVTSNIIKLLE